MNETLTIRVRAGQTTAIHAWATGWQELVFPSRAAALKWADLNGLEVTS